MYLLVCGDMERTTTASHLVEKFCHLNLKRKNELTFVKHKLYNCEPLPGKMAETGNLCEDHGHLHPFSKIACTDRKLEIL